MAVLLSWALVALILPTAGHGQNPDTKSDTKNEGLEIRVLQVYCERGEEPAIPKKLQPYAKDLKRTGNNRFSLATREKKYKLLKNKPIKIRLEGKLGDAILTLQSKDTIKISVVQKNSKKPKTIGAKLGKHPFILRDASLKTSDGKELILILEPRKAKAK